MTATKTNERPGTRAQAKNVRMSATKARAVLDLIRNKSIDEAGDVLTYTERGAAEVIGKLLDSAVANAEHNDGQLAEELVAMRVGRVRDLHQRSWRLGRAAPWRSRWARGLRLQVTRCYPACTPSAIGLPPRSSP